MEILDERSWGSRALDALDRSPDGWLAAGLSPFAALYAAGGRLRRSLRPSRPLPLRPPSIGIGNLRVGGTGKTPVVEDLARRLGERGHAVTVLSRGYRATGGGDEPEWLRSRLGVPVLLDRDRLRGYRRAVEDGAGLILLDDALQCGVRPVVLAAIVLERDLGRIPRCLPAGPAREDPHVLEEIDLLLVRRENSGEPREDASGLRTASAAARLDFRLTPHSFLDPEGQELPLGKAPSLGPCLLLSGLARPLSFERDCRRLGLEIELSLRMDDHCDPDDRAGARIEALIARREPRSLIAPEKNLARLAALKLSRPLWALRSRIEWEGGDPLQILDPLLDPTG